MKFNNIEIDTVLVHRAYSHVDITQELENAGSIIGTDSLDLLTVLSAYHESKTLYVVAIYNTTAHILVGKKPREVRRLLDKLSRTHREYADWIYQRGYHSRDGVRVGYNHCHGYTSYENFRDGINQCLAHTDELYRLPKMFDEYSITRKSKGDRVRGRQAMRANYKSTL